MLDWHKVWEMWVEGVCSLQKEERDRGRKRKKGGSRRRRGLNQLGTVKPCGSTDGKREYEEMCSPQRGLPFLGFSFRHTPTGSQQIDERYSPEVEAKEYVRNKGALFSALAN